MKDYFDVLEKYIKTITHPLDDLFYFGDVLDQDVLQTEDTSDSLDADKNDEVSAFEALTEK